MLPDIYCCIKNARTPMKQINCYCFGHFESQTGKQPALSYRDGRHKTIWLTDSCQRYQSLNCGVIFTKRRSMALRTRCIRRTKYYDFLYSKTISVLNLISVKKRPWEGAEKSAVVQSLDAKIFSSSSIPAFFFASCSMVPTNPFTIPRRKRSALIS